MPPLSATDTDCLLADLRAAVGPKRWALWFDGATAIQADDGHVTVGVANLFISDYIQSHFSDRIAEAVRRRMGRDVPIAYRVQPDLFRRRREKNLRDEEEAADALEPSQAPEPDAEKTALRPDPCEPQAAAAPAGKPARTRSQAGGRPIFTLENFVVGPCNQMAYAAAKAAASAPGGEFHPLFIHGACGLGKTHLIYGILHALRRERPELKVALLSAEQFTNRYLTGMRNHSLDAFRHRYRNLDVLAIDDIHFLGGKPSTQEEFLHTFNEFDGRDRLVILASDAHPREIAAIEDRLVSRWVAGLVVRLSHPDAETRRRILAAKAAEVGYPVEPGVLDFIAHQVQGNVRDLEGALTRTIACAALLKHPLTVSLARQAIADGGMALRPKAGLQKIETETCAFFGVSVAEIHSRRKSRRISLARQVAMVLARELTDLSYNEIARLMGGKNHTTVLAACRKWKKLCGDGVEVNWTDQTDVRSMPAPALLEQLKDRVRR